MDKYEDRLREQNIRLEKEKRKLEERIRRLEWLLGLTNGPPFNEPDFIQNMEKK